MLHNIIRRRVLIRDLAILGRGKFPDTPQLSNERGSGVPGLVEKTPREGCGKESRESVAGSSEGSGGLEVRAGVV